MAPEQHSPTPVSDLLRLDGKVAAVTGAARGIGQAIATRLAEAGAAVVATDLDQAELDEMLPKLAGDNNRAMRVDVGEASEVHAAAQFAVDELGGLDIWVNNAGIFPASASDPLETPVTEFERVLHINLTGTYLGMQACGRTMRADGVILNIASTESYEGHGAYAASKWSVRGLTKGMAPVFAPRGIRVVAIAPTVIGTPGIAEFRESRGHVLNAIEDRIPLGREGVPDDVARAALFLVSDAASFITGVTLPVDGGILSGPKED